MKLDITECDIEMWEAFEIRLQRNAREISLTEGAADMTRLESIGDKWCFWIQKKYRGNIL